MAGTNHTTIRFPEQIKRKLQALADLDGISRTAIIINLINNEYKSRKDEIKEAALFSSSDEKIRDN